VASWLAILLAVAMRDRLREVGARHELVALEGAPHGMEN
jgi:hypothetical protein